MLPASSAHSGRGSSPALDLPVHPRPATSLRAPPWSCTTTLRRFCTLLALTALLGWGFFACSPSSAPAPSAPEAERPSVPSDAPDARAAAAREPTNAPTPPVQPDTVDTPGLHETQGGWALALKTGIARDELNPILQQAVEAGTLRMGSTKREHRVLRELRLSVTTQDMFPLKKSELDRLRLSFFENTLVGVLLIYKTGNAERVLAYMSKFGDAARAEGWLGWWLTEERLVVQASPDGVVYELFDLEAARPMVPFIDDVMAVSWRQRYGDAPR